MNNIHPLHHPPLSYLIRVTFCLISILSVIGMTGCWGEPDDPIDAIYSYNAEIETTLTAILVAAQGYVDELHVDTINYSNGYWESAHAPITAIRLSDTKPPAWTPYSAGAVLAFGDEALANEESVSFVIEMPHAYEEDSPVILCTKYALPADAAGAAVRWKLEYAWANIGEAIPATDTIYTLTSTTAVADTIYCGSFAPLDGTGKKMRSIIIGTLTRNSSDAADDFAGDIYLLEIDLYYQQDSPGSATPGVK